VLARMSSTVLDYRLPVRGSARRAKSSNAPNMSGRASGAGRDIPSMSEGFGLPRVSSGPGNICDRNGKGREDRPARSEAHSSREEHGPEATQNLSNHYPRTDSRSQAETILIV